MTREPPGTDRPPWAGRVPRHLIERLYRTDAQGIVDEALIDEVGYALLARCESSLAVGLGPPPVCPGCLRPVTRTGDQLACDPCRWSCTLAAYRRSHKGNRLVAGRMAPFFRAYVDDFRRARAPRYKMRLIDILIHRFHGELERSGLRAGAINLIGGKPREVIALLDRLAGHRSAELAEAHHHDAWVDRVRRQREAAVRGSQPSAAAPAALAAYVLGSAALLRSRGRYLFEVQKPERWTVRDGRTVLGVGCIGGGVEPGESPMQAMRREALEEIGCRLRLQRAADPFVVPADAAPVPAPASLTASGAAFLWSGYLPEHRPDVCVAVFRGIVLGTPEPGDLPAILRLDAGHLARLLHGGLALADVQCLDGGLVARRPLPAGALLEPVGTAAFLARLRRLDEALFRRCLTGEAPR